jgi:fucose permease
MKNDNDTNKKVKFVPDYGVRLLCLICFLYIGIICSIGGWASSYAVMEGIQTKEGAVIYPTLFWGFLSTARFFGVCLPGTGSSKLKVCIYASFVIQIVSFIIKIFGFTNESLYFQSIFLGITISPLYPIIYSISKEYGY